MTDINALVEARQKIKDWLEKAEAAFKASIVTAAERLVKIDGMLMAALDEIGVENVKTAHGTVYFTHPESMRVIDKEAFFEWVAAENAFDVLTSAVSKDAIRERGEMPPGVEVTRIRKLCVRKN